ncbi:MAG: DUF6263 family protein, partial [Chitinophagaceae bacterium]
CLLFAISTSLCAQKVSGKLRFEQGQTITISMEVKNNIAQQAGAQAINFLANGSAVHRYQVTNLTNNSTTLHHELQKLSFQFEGMGQKRAFNSENEEDRKGQFGPLFEEILSKKFDITIDSTGKTITAVPDKIQLTKPDVKLVTITDMLKDLTQLVYPNKKGTGSFFYVIPAGEKSAGDSWTETTDTDNEKSTTVNTLSAITDSTIVIDFKTTSSAIIKSEVMGRQTKTNLNNITTGKITLDRNTHLIKEKTSIMDSNGTTEAMGGMVPISGKTTISILVK